MQRLTLGYMHGATRPKICSPIAGAGRAAAAGLDDAPAPPDEDGRGGMTATAAISQLLNDTSELTTSQVYHGKRYLQVLRAFVSGNEFRAFFP